MLKFAHPGLTCKVHEPSSGHIVLLKYLGGGRYDVLIDDDKFSELVVHQKIGTCDAFEE